MPWMLRLGIAGPAIRAARSAGVRSALKSLKLTTAPGDGGGGEGVAHMSACLSGTQPSVVAAAQR